MDEAPVFSSSYRRGVLFLSAPSALVSAFFIAPSTAVLHSLKLAVLVTALSLVISVVTWTWLRRRRPALILSRDGVHIDGLPQIPWPDIAGVDPVREDPSLLEVRLTLPPSPTRGLFSRGRALVTPLWRPAPPKGILLRTSLLEDARAEIEGAFRYFLSRGAQTA
jgi:hypothetical protein